jgi:hypothetical protein
MKTPSRPGAAKRNMIEPTTGMITREGWSMTGPLRRHCCSNLKGHN